MIHQFIKNKKGQMVGCVVAIDRNRVGWSKCRTTFGNIDSGNVIFPDVFNKQRALDIACGRAKLNPVLDIDDVPMSIRPFVANMIDRSLRYYKFEQK